MKFARLAGVVLLAFGLGLVLVSCNNRESELKALQDSIARAKRTQDSLEAIRVQDSIEEAQNNALMDEYGAGEADMSASASDPSLKFHVIRGSFVVQANADNFLAQMRQQYPEAKLFIAPNGFKLVSIGDFASLYEAQAMISRLQSSDEEIRLWVYEEGGPYNTSSWLSERDGDGYGDDDDEDEDGGDSYYDLAGDEGGDLDDTDEF